MHRGSVSTSGSLDMSSRGSGSGAHWNGHESSGSARGNGSAENAGGNGSAGSAGGNGDVGRNVGNAGRGRRIGCKNIQRGGVSTLERVTRCRSQNAGGPAIVLIPSKL